VLVQEIGSGATSLVYRAQCAAGECAVKVFRLKELPETAEGFFFFFFFFFFVVVFFLTPSRANPEGDFDAVSTESSECDQALCVLCSRRRSVVDGDAADCSRLCVGCDAGQWLCFGNARGLHRCDPWSHFGGVGVSAQSVSYSSGFGEKNVHLSVMCFG
jgi:hypothetical protein